jgi:hypothetical protein
MTMARLRIRERLSYANVVASLALVGVVGGGGAYAANKIGSKDINDGSIRSVDLRNGKAVQGADVLPNSLRGKQIREETLDISSLVAMAGAEPVGCNPTGPQPVVCAQAEVNLPRPAQLLAIATGGQESNGGPAKASCQVRVDGAATALSATPGEESSDNTSVSATNGFARTRVTPGAVGAGPHTVDLACSELSGDVRIENPTLAVLAVRGG